MRKLYVKVNRTRAQHLKFTLNNSQAMHKILIIDDEPEMLQGLKKILSQRKEFTIELAQDPKWAVDIVKKSAFDLIITDLKMGQISGMDILDAARSRDKNANVILISGYGTIEASVSSR